MSQLLSRLDGVRHTATGRWLARCPSHDDRSPSLSIRELDDGRTLLHCFAGCSATDVLEAVGLGLRDLFPEPLCHAGDGVRPNHWHAAREGLRLLAREALLVVVAAENLATGIALADADRDRLFVAADRIRRAAEAVR
jgi:hypothetical protein